MLNTIIPTSKLEKMQLLYLLIILFLTYPIHAIAQSDFYYYKGNKIPLTLNVNKVCVNIPKICDNTNKRIRTIVQVLDTINDETFDILVISKSDYEKLTSLDFWREDSKVVIITPSYFTEDGTEVFASPYINLQLKKEQDENILYSYAEMYKLKVVENDSLMPLWYILAITNETEGNSLESANMLWETGEFAASVADLCSDDLNCTNDPLFNQQWGLYNNSHTNIDISACSAWNYSTGKNMKIAILDTGIDMNHIDLSSNIYNLSYDTETKTSPSILYYDHGTHCAGIAAAVADNGVQIAGVAPEATIVSISNTLHSTTNSRLKRADGIKWAYQHGVDIISNSWGSSTYHDAINEAINEAFRFGRQGKGCVIVFASGNQSSNNVSYPANCNDTIIVVGAINRMGARAYYSNYGVELDVVAPGDSIKSTLPNDSIGMKSGTSMACPHVAGVAALILERNPELTVSQVNSIINSNSKKIAGVNFNVIKADGLWNNEYGYGLVDAYNSVINTPHVVYIQNDTITGTRTISADSIYVGRDVTNTKENGNVVLGQGTISLKADFIEIKNSTTVPLGTSLMIGQ